MKTTNFFTTENLSYQELIEIKGGNYDGGPVDLNDEDIDMPDL